MKKVLLTLYVVLVGQLCAVAQQHVLADSRCSKALCDIYQCDYEAFEQSVSQVSDAASAAYLREYRALMEYTQANNADNYARYMQASDAAIDAAPGGRYPNTAASNLLLHRCLVELSNGSLWGGGVQFWKSYRAFKAGEDATPNYDGQLMLRGIFNILLSQIPDKWKGLAGFFGFGRGNLDEGFRQIAQYRERVEHVPGLSDESLLMSFANIFLSHEQRVDEALANKMRASGAPVVAYAYMLSLGRQQKGAEAQQLLASLPDDMYARFPLLYHQRAKFALRQRHTADARRYVQSFMDGYKGVACRNDAYLIRAYSYLLDGNRAKAVEQANICVSMKAASDVDSRTLADARRIADTDIVLLRSRMCFEFGDYRASLDALYGFKPTAATAIEYNFRKARALEKLGALGEAEALYNKTISLAKTDKRFFGPYSAVYMADIKLASGDKAAARSYLSTAKSLNNGEFTKEIDQRIAITLRAIGE